MADPTAAVNRNIQHYGGFSKAKVVSAEELVRGGLVAEIYGTGEIQFLADEANAWPTGYVVQPEFGSSLTGTALDTEADVGVVVRGDVVVEDLAVTGVSSYADKGKPVFGTEGDTLTLTRPADDAVACGFVYDKGRADTTTTCDVFLFGKATSWMFSVLGGNKRRIYLNPIHTSLLEGTSALTLDTQTLFGHGKIVGWGYKATGFGAGYAAGDQTLNIAIGGTTVKKVGAVAADLAVAATAVDAAADVAAPVSGSAPLTANEWHDGDELTVLLVASGTGFTAGQDEVSIVPYLDVEYLPGA